MEDIISRKSFAELTIKVNKLLKSQSWFQRYGVEFLVLGFRFVLFALSLWIFSFPGWIFKIVGMLMLSFNYYGIAITGTHETRHNSFAKTKGANRVWAYFFSDFWGGQSNIWWHRRHVLDHHNNCNIRGLEGVEFFFPGIDRYTYFFILPFLVVIWLGGHSAFFLRKKSMELALFLAAYSAGWAFHIGLFMLVLPIGYAVLATFIMRSLFAPVFMQIAVFNHIGLENPKSLLAWIKHQSITTRNLKPNWFLDGIGGNAFIECHLEHHLFPSLSNHMLSRIRPIVVEHLKKDGYPYYDVGYFTVLRDCLKNYRQWFDPAVINSILANQENESQNVRDESKG